MRLHGTEVQSARYYPGNKSDMPPLSIVNQRSEYKYSYIYLFFLRDTITLAFDQII